MSEKTISRYCPLILVNLLELQVFKKNSREIVKKNCPPDNAVHPLAVHR